MLSKAKTLTGEWVTGISGKDTRPVNTQTQIIQVESFHCIFPIDENGIFTGATHEVNPSTLCQQVRETPFFEGDEVTDGDLTGFIYFCRAHLQYKVDLGKIKMYLHFPDWKPTGKNKHDD